MNRYRRERRVFTNTCGIYIHGWDKPFLLKDNLTPLTSFWELSEQKHTLYLFFAVDGEIEEAVDLFPSIIPIKIDKMRSIADYDEFMMRKCFHLIREENTLTMHQDGWLLRPGWEEFAKDWDYLGASWHRHIPDFDLHYKAHFSLFSGWENVHTTTTVGNGGFCWRKRSKMLEVERSVDWSTRTPGRLPDDVFYSFWGFGQNIFRPVPLEVAEEWSQEPLVTKVNSYGFHGLNVTKD